MESVLTAASICAAIFIGWNILYLVSFKDDGLSFAERIFIGYGLGVGFISLEMLLLFLLGIDFTIRAILAPWLAVVLVNAAIYSRYRIRFPSEKPAQRQGHRVLRVVLLTGLSFEMALAFFNALIKPIESYDAVAIYAVKSKIFYLAKTIPHDYFRNLALAFPHSDYPLNIPLFETYIYTFVGGLNDQLVKIMFPLFYAAAIGVLYFAVRRFASRTYALLFAFLMASVPQFSAYAQNAYADLPMAYYCFTSAVFLFMWFQDTGRVSCLYISAVMAALAGWTKNEGLMYCLINFIVIGVFLVSNAGKSKKKEALFAMLYVLTVIVILYPFLWVRGAWRLVNSDLEFPGAGLSSMAKQFYRIRPILYEFQKEFFGPKKWNILWPMTALVFIFRFRKALSGIQGYTAVYIALAALGYISVYVASTIDINFFVEKTMSRFMVHFMPFVVYWLALVLKEDIGV